MYPTMPVPSVGQSHYVTAEDFKTSQGKRDEQALFYSATQSIFH